jgi:hypothetical protein
VERSETFYPLLCEIVKFHFGFRRSDKRSFSIFVEDKKLFVRRTAGLSLLSLGWEEKKN